LPLSVCASKNITHLESDGYSYIDVRIKNEFEKIKEQIMDLDLSNQTHITVVITLENKRRLEKSLLNCIVGNRKK
jgi:hypothetical protein